MEGSKKEETNMEANRFPLEKQPLGTSTQTTEYDRGEPSPQSPCFEVSELRAWSFYRAGIAEFMATFLFMYISILTVMGVNNAPGKCSTVGPQGIAWAFGGMIFVLVYCTAGISGGHINLAVTFGFLLIRKISIIRAIFYVVMQCAGAICGAGVVKVFLKSQYELLGGGINTIVPGHHELNVFFAEIFGTFVLVYAVFSASDTKINAKDSYLPVLAPVPIGFAVFLVHLATMPISKTGINPAKSLGAAVIYNKEDAFDKQWIFWIGPLIGAALAALYHRIILRPVPFRCCSF